MMLLSVLLSFLCLSSPAWAVTWPNEPAGSAPLLDCRFTCTPGASE